MWQAQKSDHDPWVHVIPTADSKEHTPYTHCHCKPQIDWENQLVIHNAFDHREAVEEANRILEGDDK